MASSQTAAVEPSGPLRRRSRQARLVKHKAGSLPGVFHPSRDSPHDRPNNALPSPETRRDPEDSQQVIRQALSDSKTDLCCVFALHDLEAGR